MSKLTELEEIGQSDLRIVLIDQGYAVWQETPGPIHNAAVRRIKKSFEKWEKEQGAVLYGEKEADLYYMKNFKKDNKRNLAESAGTSSSSNGSTGDAGKKSAESSPASSVKKPAAKPAAKESEHA